MLNINTYEEKYIININEIVYINIYEDDENIMNIDIYMKNDYTININEKEISRNKIIDISNNIGMINI